MSFNVLRAVTLLDERFVANPTEENVAKREVLNVLRQLLLSLELLVASRTSVATIRVIIVGMLLLRVLHQLVPIDGNKTASAAAISINLQILKVLKLNPLCNHALLGHLKRKLDHVVVLFRIFLLRLLAKFLHHQILLLLFRVHPLRTFRLIVLNSGGVILQKFYFVRVLFLDFVLYRYVEGNRSKTKFA